MNLSLAQFKKKKTALSTLSLKIQYHVHKVILLLHLKSEGIEC